MKLEDSTTPGPWAASFAENSGYDCMTGAWSIRSVPAQRFVAVLDLGSYGQKSCQEGFTSVEAESNARLIAAAPDLLAVAKSFVALYDGVRDVLVSDGVKAKLAAAEAAIAKAVAVVAVLLIAATASAEPKPSGFKAVMLGTFLTGGVLDIKSTCQGLANGGREVVLTQSCGTNAAVISGEMAAGVYGLNKLHKTHPTLAVTIGIAAGVFRMGIASHNLRVTR